MLITANISDAAIFISRQDGNWNNVNAWEQDSTFTPALRTPRGGDTVIIKPGHTITINNQYDFSGQDPMYIQIEGILEFDTGKKLRMAAGSGVKLIDAGSIVIPGNGGGNSNIIEIGGTVLWKSGDGPLSGPSDLGTTPTFPLPVSWVFVDVQKSENQNSILWRTSSEENTSHFEIERSIDFIKWESIGKVYPNENGIYNYNDGFFKSGLNYYRIKHIETNNAVNISKIVSVFNTSIPQEFIQIYPNPCLSEVHIKGLNNTKVSINVISMNGIISNPSISFNSEETIVEVNTLQSGNYILMISGAGIQKSIPFIKK